MIEEESIQVLLVTPIFPRLDRKKKRSPRHADILLGIQGLIRGVLDLKSLGTMEEERHTYIMDSSYAMRIRKCLGYAQAKWGEAYLEHDIQPQLSTEWGNRFQSTMDAFEQDSPSIQFKIESKEIYWVDICGKRNEYGIVQGRHIDHFFKNGSFPLYIVDAFSRREEETFYAYNR